MKRFSTVDLSSGRPKAAALLCLLLAAFLSACSDPPVSGPGGAPPSVSVSRVLEKNVRPVADFNGRVEAVGNVELRPRVSGYIESVRYVEGQEVRKGDVLFVIDDRSLAAELARTTAELSRAQSQLELARGEAARAKLLVDERAIATEMWEQRNGAFERAVAEVQAVKASVDQARLNLDWTRVRAPISGRAGRALVTPGNMVSAGDRASVLTTLVTIDPVHVHFEADEATFLRFVTFQRSRQLPVHVGLVGETGHPHEGRLDFLDNRVSRQTGTITLRAVLADPGRTFTPGLFARVQLPVSEPFDALLLDDRAVLTDQDRKYVFVVDAQGHAQRRDVELGEMVEGLRVARKGLAAGDRIVVEGVRRIMRPGLPVRVQEVEMASRAAVEGRVQMSREPGR